MNAPTLGVTLPPYLTGEQLRNVARIADESDLHSLWVTDRTIVDSPWMETLTVLGALAATTERVRVGTSVLVLPRRNPVLLAQSLATVDHLTDGRLIAGFGVGDPRLTGPGELALAAVDPQTRGRLADDYLALLDRLWDGEAVTYRSETCLVQDAAVGLRPSSDIPVWIGGASAGACARAGRFGDGWLATMTTPELYGSQLESVRDSASRHHRDESAITPAIYLFGAIDQDGVSSARLLDAALQGFLGAPLEAMADSCVWGTPDQWAETIHRWQDVGVQHVNVALFAADLAGDLELVGSAVLPRLGASTSVR